jgi:pyridoxal phosphate enzyme (YggS family)
LIEAQEIRERADAIRARIAAACRRSGRRAEGVRLVAVTKTHPAEAVREALAAGLSDFGENRVQEGIRKIEVLRPDFPQAFFRLIGPLQTNKVKRALQYFSEIQTVDREALVEKIAAAAREEGRTVPIYLEVNIGAEASKSGIAPESAPELLERALREPSLSVRGLMAVPPYFEDPEEVRPYFLRLRELRDRLAETSGAELPELSMGMSHDFEVAVEEGATVVRIGTALFGPRRAP